MKVVLKKDKVSAKFNLTFKKGFVLEYNESLGCVQHPMHPNIWIKVKESEFEVAKNYIIVGDNNFWYYSTGFVTKKALADSIKFVKQGIKDGIFSGQDGEPSELCVYEIKGLGQTIEL